MLEDKTFVIEDFKSPVSHYPTRKLGKAEIRKHRVRKNNLYWAEGVRGHLFYRHDKTFEETVLLIGGRININANPVERPIRSTR